jgi:voltage-gated potassium channel
VEKPSPASRLKTQRIKLLVTITAMTDKLMVGLALVWIGLMIGDLIGRLPRPLVILNYVIWAIFGADFVAKFILAPGKVRFLKKNWITVISLILPGFRLLRIFQALAALRVLSLVRILASLNLGMGAISRAMGKRGAGYVIVISLIVLFGGAAGMYHFEQPSQLVQQGYGSVAASGGGLKSYSDAVWWTAMLMTTIGSQYWPVTMAGRVLCFLLSMFSLGVFGYITAVLASFFVGQDKEEDKDKQKKLDKREASQSASLETLLKETEAMRAQMAAIEALLKQRGT